MMIGWINSTYLALTPAKKAQLKSENYSFHAKG